MNDRWLDDTVDPRRKALRQALDEASREPVSEVRKRRVWNRLQSAGHHQPRATRAFWMGALAASVAMAGVWFAAVRPDRAWRQAPVVVKTVTVQPRVEPLPADVPVAGQAITVFATGAAERMTRNLSHGVRAELAPASRLVVALDGRPEVQNGAVRFAVPRQEAGQRFVVQLSSYQVVVLGTRFVAHANPGEIGVDVEEGRVEIWDVARNQRLVDLAPGETWRRTLEGPALGPRHAPARTGASSSRAPRVDPPAADDVMASARAARVSDPRRALALYGQLAQQDGPQAENALYEMGAIYRDKLRDPHHALAAWESYRTRFPRGLLRMEADLSIVDTLSSTGDQARALAEAKAFLDRYPRSERRSEMARVAGDLERARGNCAAAVRHYDDALRSHAAGDDADDSAFHRASCLARLNPGRAADSLRAYLARFPAGRHAAEANKALATGAQGGGLE